VSDRHRICPDPETQFEVVPPDADVPFSRITAVAVVALLRSGEIVSVVQRRGIDIPGGHVQEGETSIEEVAMREAREEAEITLEPIIPIAYLRSPTPLADGTCPSYIAVVGAFVRDLLPFENRDEEARVICSVDNFVDRYSAGDRAIMRTLVEMASEALVGLASTCPSPPEGSSAQSQ
jgi:8-oxo-dGTP pyrophosphatase MutT (NUDIX family)